MENVARPDTCAPLRRASLRRQSRNRSKTRPRCKKFGVRPSGRPKKSCTLSGRTEVRTPNCTVRAFAGARDSLGTEPSRHGGYAQTTCPVNTCTDRNDPLPWADSGRPPRPRCKKFGVRPSGRPKKSCTLSGRTEVRTPNSKFELSPGRATVSPSRPDCAVTRCQHRVPQTSCALWVFRSFWKNPGHEGTVAFGPWPTGEAATSC